jgi:AcrR family transcriptional regulator
LRIEKLFSARSNGSYGVEAAACRLFPGDMIAARPMPSAKKTPLRARKRRRTTPARSASRTSRRSDILERAAELIGRKGFAGMSARDLAGELDFSKANFFYHVRSKEDLLHEIFVETLNNSIRHIEEIVTRAEPHPDRLKALMDFYVRLNTERATVMLVWFKEKEHLTLEHQAQILALEHRIAAMLNEFYRGGVESGHFQPIDPRIARVVIFGMCFALTRWPQLRDEFSPQALSAQIWKVASAGLLRSDH